MADAARQRKIADAGAAVAALHRSVADEALEAGVQREFGLRVEDSAAILIVPL